MGNCLKSGVSNDDVSLITDHDVSSNPSQRNSSRIDHLSSDSPPSYNESVPTYYPSPGNPRTASQLTEEEQIKIAKRIGLIQQLPTGVYDGSKKNGRECAICMGDFLMGDTIRYLPCCHTFHQECIDDWLMRSFTCPSCMEAVDATLLRAFGTDDFLPPGTCNEHDSDDEEEANNVEDLTQPRLGRLVSIDSGELCGAQATL